MLLNSRYRVIQTLGGGGFGDTFLAEDTQMPSRRRCVVKLLKPITNNPQIYQLVQERFGREAAILEELGGKNEQIPNLYAYFESDGQFYLVQEWIEGVTLSKLVRDQGILNEDQVREILVQILPVLEYVHQQHIIHRDIKPDNIILRKQDGKPVLIDFGAVRESMGTVVNSQGNPTSSIVIGTPGYMPSEQAAGRPIYSSDLYSLGMTAIYLLTGKIPQELATDPQTGEIIWQEFAPHLHPEFVAILNKSIAYHPRDRFSSAQAMQAALISSVPTVAPTQYVVDANQTVASENSQNQVLKTITASPANNISPRIQPQDSSIKKGLMVGGLVVVSVAIGFAIASSNSPPKSTEVTTNLSPSAVNSNQSKSQVNPQPSQLLENQQISPESKSNNQVSNQNNNQPTNNSTNLNNPSIISTPVTKTSPEINNQTPDTSTSPELNNQPPATNTGIDTNTNTNTNTDTDYSWLSERRVNQSDLIGKDAFTLDIMRNSIYARRGFRFKTPGIQAYFNQQPWYRPIYPPASQMQSENILSKLEIENAVFIRNYQKTNNLFYF
ncbi:protein kinase domain-containing protein [Calothrix sp. NIES-3974]|uniref:protein kinase domain-containing protein n=1 Tax=Calothrix sp. NIES-3974 TaxID=2005462 RepID=UPI000B5F8245|nr:YARHG domain-containing protein [Calothrix sp. NIES-3974]BAZ04229.1 serine/threonine protein kinase [Calothrix sp. NIES-3974]